MTKKRNFVFTTNKPLFNPTKGSDQNNKIVPLDNQKKKKKKWFYIDPLKNNIKQEKSSFDILQKKLPVKVLPVGKKKPALFIKLLNHILKKKSFVKAPFNCFYTNWINYWSNSHEQFYADEILRIIRKICKYDNLLLNKFFLVISNQTIKVHISTLGIFTVHKAESKFKQQIKYLQQLYCKKRLVKSSASWINLTDVSEVNFLLYNAYVPQNFGLILGARAFQKDRHERYFSESLQALNIIFRGDASSEIFGTLIYKYTRRNPKRIRFLSFLKRLIDWYFVTIAKRDSKIAGIRAEIKGRFTAKSRTKKQILSVGRIRINEADSPVDHKQFVATTKFGSLGIKVWVCPKSNYLSNVTFT
jgi:hypothetical protein